LYSKTCGASWTAASPKAPNGVKSDMDAATMLRNLEAEIFMCASTARCRQRGMLHYPYSLQIGS
jgi:hypothetical protein